MNSKIRSFHKSLMDWYQKSARILLWRQTHDPYKIWISEIMLQQTTVAVVVPYYERWIKRFPNIRSVARSSLQTILKYWQGLGYYSRARNIHATAKIVSKIYDGMLPNNKEILSSLPGFGPYTVGAVLSIAFDQREPIIDANVRRVVMRQLKIEGKAKSGHEKAIYDFLLSVMPQENNRIFNQSLMELGALVCRNKNPSCLTCPIMRSCQAYRHGVVEIIPEPKKVSINKVYAAVAIIEHEGKIFLQRRLKKGLFADLWEFPGGKIEKGESARDAVIREVREELGIDLDVLKSCGQVVHFYTQFKAHLSVWRCRPLNMPKLNKDRKWLRASDLKKYPMSSGSAKIVSIISGFKGRVGQ